MSRPVLFVEDDSNYRLSVKCLFSSDMYQFVEAASPAEGIELLKMNPQVRVILLDLSFDGSEVTEILEYVKQRPDDYRVIVLTAHDELLLAERAREYTVFNYLPKATQSATQAIRFSIDQAFKDLERAHLIRKVGFLLDVQRKVTGRESEQTLDLICQSVLSTVGAYTCHIRVYDFRKGDYHLGGFAGAQAKMRRIFERPKAKGDDFSGIVVETGRAEYFEDLQEMERFKKFKALALKEGQISAEEDRYWQMVRSAYIVPISTGLFGDAVDAVLNVSSEYRGFFNNDKCALVDEFVTLAALTITKGWLQRKREEIHQDYSRISEMLSEISEGLKGHRILEAVYGVVIRWISEIVNAEVVSIFLFNNITGMIENVAELRGSTRINHPNEVYLPGESFTGSVYANERTIQLPEPGDTTRVKPMQDPRYDHGKTEKYLHNIPSGYVEHYLGVPIRIGGRIRGVLRAVNKKSEYYHEFGHSHPLCLLDRGFSPDCRNALEITASHLAVAIRNAELISDKEQQLEQIRLLGEVGRLINSERDIEEVLKLTIQNMAEVMQSEICMVFLKDQDDNRIVLKQCFGIPMIRGAFYGIGEGVTGRVADTGIPQLIMNAEESNGKYDEQIRQFLAEKHKHPTLIDSLMVVPIIAKGKILGAMKVINKKGDHLKYTEDDLTLFRTFGDYVAVGIENAQIYKVTNEQLAVAERNAALSLLVTAVAHEINNTSGVIPANVRALKKELKATNPRIDRMLAVIEDAASQATEFANEIGGFSAKRKGEIRALDVNEVIHGWIHELMSHVRKHKKWKDIEVKLLLSETPLVCKIYRRPFIQIVRNVIINAFQALEKKGKGSVQISTWQGADDFQGMAVIQIDDDGPGITQVNQEKIFDPFFTTKSRGNGIGLWLVRTQLALVDGKIEVISTPGEGAKFIIRIPIFAAASEN